MSTLYSCVPARVSQKSYLCLSLSPTWWLSNEIQQQIQTSLLTQFFFCSILCQWAREKADLFFLLKRGIHISHRTPIIGSNQGLTTLGMPLKSWESHVQKEVISNIFLWSTLYICCMWVSSNHTHTHPKSSHKSTIYPPASNELMGSFRDIKIHWSFETLTLKINYEHYKFEFSSENKSRAHLKIIKINISQQFIIFMHTLWLSLLRRYDIKPWLISKFWEIHREQQVHQTLDFVKYYCTNYVVKIQHKKV